MRFVSASAVLALLLLAGCGSDGGSSSNDHESLEGVPWTTHGGATATFANGTVGGSTGCNHYTASYTLDGGRMTIGTVAATQMACPPPRDKAEREYLAALGKVRGWFIDNDQLFLTGSDDSEVLLTYSIPTPDGDYEATAIRTVDAVASPLPGTTVTARFADGKVSGSAGCNTYSASYTTDRGSIHIDPPASTKKLCTDPEGVMTQEADFLAALEAADNFRTEGPHALALLAADGTYLVAFGPAS